MPDLDLTRRRIDAMVDEIVALETALRDIAPRCRSDREANRIMKRIIEKLGTTEKPIGP